MRWAAYRDEQGRERAGLVSEMEILALEPGVTLLGLLRGDGERLAAAAERARANPAEVQPLDQTTLLPPIPRPPSFRDFYAFEQHVRTARQRRGLDMEPEWYNLPVFYFSNAAAILGPGDDIAVPPGCEALDFELEVAAIVGRGGSNLSPADAERCI